MLIPIFGTVIILLTISESKTIANSVDENEENQFKEVSSDIDKLNGHSLSSDSVSIKNNMFDFLSTKEHIINEKIDSNFRNNLESQKRSSKSLDLDKEHDHLQVPRSLPSVYEDGESYNGWRGHHNEGVYDDEGLNVGRGGYVSGERSDGQRTKRAINFDMPIFGFPAWMPRYYSPMAFPFTHNSGLPYLYPKDMQSNSLMSIAMRMHSPLTTTAMALMGGPNMGGPQPIIEFSLGKMGNPRANAGDQLIFGPFGIDGIIRRTDDNKRISGMHGLDYMSVMPNGWNG